MTVTLALLAAVVFAAYFTQTVSGFGSMVVCLTLGAHLYPIDVMLVMVVPLSLLQCGYLAARHHDGIRWRLLLTEVLPLMGIGMVGGFIVAGQLQGRALVIAFAILVMVLSARELYALIFKANHTQPPLPKPISWVLLAASGVVHGIYATGGPLLVYVVNRTGLDKRSFRSTLLVVWLVLNAVLTGKYAHSGAFNTAVLEAMAYLVPPVILGIWLGEWVHDRVDERKFRVLTFGLLGVAATTLLI